jgi:hypothetical protein
MTFSLYDATVANYLQILGAVGDFLEKSLTHFREKGIDPAEIVETRLTPDMLPLRFQIVSVAHHSRGAMEAAKNGVFAPPSGKPDLDYPDRLSALSASIGSPNCCCAPARTSGVRSS